MTFHGQSVISLVWGVVSTDSPREGGNLFSSLRSLFARRPASGRPHVGGASSARVRKKPGAAKQR